MKALQHRYFVILLTAVLLTSTAFAAIYQREIFLLIPFAVLGSFILVQYPRYLLYLLVVSIPWSIEYNITPQLGTDLPDEPLMWLASGAALLGWLHHARSDRRTGLHPLLFLIGLQLIWTLLILPSSTNLLVSFKYLLAKLWYVLAFLVLPLFIFRNRRIINHCVLLLLVSMLAAMCVALIRHGINGFTFEAINPSLEPFYRNHVNYSSILVCMVPLEIAVLRTIRSVLFKRWLTVILLITAAAIFLSYARGAWLALLLGLGSFWITRKRQLFLSYLLVLVLLCGAFIWLSRDDHYLRYSNDFKTTIFHKNFREHLVATYEMKDLSTAERFYRWVAAVRMGSDSWLTGFGPNTFVQNYQRYTLPAFRTWVSDNKEHSTVHNYFLLLFTEQGAIGLLLFVVLLGAAFWYVQHTWLQARDRWEQTTSITTGAILVMLCTINFLSDMIESDKTGSLFYLCFAVLISLSQQQQETAEHVLHN